MENNTIHTFFSFHYSYDFDRINVIIERWLAFLNTSTTPFIAQDQIAAMMEEGLPAIHGWVDEEIAKADAVVVLIGGNTFGRYFIEYEIQQALLQQKPIYGIYIHQVADQTGRIDTKSKSPLPPVCTHYDWKDDNGEELLLDWTKSAILQPIYKQCPALSYSIEALPPDAKAFEQARKAFFDSLD